MSLYRETLAGIEVLRRRGQGDGLPLVLLHGIGSDAETWAGVMQALPETLEVLAWDAPGYGVSAPLEPPFPTPADYAARLGDVLDALGWSRVLLAGHSLGTLFATSFAVAHPARVASLALLSPALGYGVAPGAPLPPNVQARIDDLEALGPPAFAAKRAARLVFRPEEKPQVLASVQRAMGAVNPPGYAQAVRALGAGTLLAEAARLTQPVLVAVGAEDVIAPPANAEALHAVLRDPLPYRLVPAAGHALPQELPVLVAEMLAEALAGDAA